MVHGLLTAGLLQDCIDACGRMLEATAGRGASGLEARVLRLRGRALAARRQLPAARADLAAALVAQPGDVDQLLLQAEVGVATECDIVMAGHAGLLCRLDVKNVTHALNSDAHAPHKCRAAGCF